MSMLNKVFDWLMESRYAPTVIAVIMLVLIGIVWWQLIKKCTITLN